MFPPHPPPLPSSVNPPPPVVRTMTGIKSPGGPEKSSDRTEILAKIKSFSLEAEQSRKFAEKFS